MLLVGGIILGLFGVPGLVYLFVILWDPSKDIEEAVPFGLYLLMSLYWLALYLIIKYRREVIDRRS